MNERTKDKFINLDTPLDRMEALPKTGSASNPAPNSFSSDGCRKHPTPSNTIWAKRLPSPSPFEEKGRKPGTGRPFNFQSSIFTARPKKQESSYIRASATT